jgi:hypothetical protein
MGSAAANTKNVRYYTPVVTLKSWSTIALVLIWHYAINIYGVMKV